MAVLGPTPASPRLIAEALFMMRRARLTIRDWAPLIAAAHMLRSLAVGAAWVLAPAAAFGAAEFGPLTGTLSVKAGANAPKSTPAVLGSAGAGISDTELVGSIDFASAGLLANIFHNSTFAFSGTATTATNANAPAGQTHATSNINFSQNFTVAAPQWLRLAAAVTSPPADPNIFASLTVTRTGPPAFALGDTGGAPVVQNGLFPAGTYTVQGSIASSATVIGTRTGIVDGSLLVAALGDFNGNMVVDGPDLATWRAGYGSLSGTFASGNLDGDGDADGFDFLLWQNQLGTHALAVAATSATPEPSAAALSTLALVGAAAGYRARRSAARRASRSPAR